MEKYQKYIDEMKKFQKMAVSAAAVPDTQKQSVGTLEVVVTALKNTLALEGTRVTVFKEENGNIIKVASAVTDQSGKTEKIELPAPDKKYSLSPGSKEKPYATYSVSVEADGYRDRVLTNLSVFSGVESIIRVELTPISAAGDDKSPMYTDEKSEFNL